jgi:hypothetical protein
MLVLLLPVGLIFNCRAQNKKPFHSNDAAFSFSDNSPIENNDTVEWIPRLNLF